MPRKRRKPKIMAGGKRDHRVDIDMRIEHLAAKYAGNEDYTIGQDGPWSPPSRPFVGESDGWEENWPWSDDGD